MIFYCIVSKKGEQKYTTKILQHACNKEGVEFHFIESAGFDFSKKITLEPKSLLYRISTDSISGVLERFLTNSNDLITLKHPKQIFLDNTIDRIFAFSAHNISYIPSVATLTRDRDLLKNHAEKLDGFPLIIKETNGSHGVGVMKIESLESLYSIADFLLTIAHPEDFIMRKYIDYVAHARLIVLGDKVIDSIEYTRVESDFRSNVGKKINVLAKKFANDIEENAIKATHVIGLNFGGVDVLITADNHHYVAEVNFPCYFGRCQQTTGTDIAHQMIQFLKTAALKKT